MKAVIFDLDGVITDTASYHFKAWKQLAASLEIEMDEQFNEQLKGISRIESLEKILAKGKKLDQYTEQEIHQLAQQKNEVYKELINGLTSADILPGILPFLQELKENSIKIAIASASKNAPFILEKLEINQYFDTIVDPDSLKKGKPAPDIFLKGAEQLFVHSSDCVGIEDAPAGVDSINAASMVSIGVGSSDQLRKADVVLSSTEKLTYEIVNQAWKDHCNKS
ncbi:beta-phosphoglucomutase [Neobacillus soli]|uniref:beta-phosphoglucomutase n=1 Tax=Neobacillus soli TaxID=220688 RepID=UPI0008245536|nr:beta-phosphoglucomutase [Neobacillus soli]